MLYLCLYRGTRLTTSTPDLLCKPTRLQGLPLARVSASFTRHVRVFRRGIGQYFQGAARRIGRYHRKERCNCAAARAQNPFCFSAPCFFFPERVRIRLANAE